MNHAEFLISVAVLLAVTFAADQGSPLFAAVASTAPTGVPLSLYLVQGAAADGAKGAAAEAFLFAACKGLLAALGFCGGALLAAKNGGGESFGSLCLCGYGAWALAWRVLQAA